MNTQKIAAALRLLADAIATDSSDESGQPAATQPETQGGAVRRGRPPKAATPAAAAAAAPAATAPVAATITDPMAVAAAPKAVDPMAVAASTPAPTQVIPAQVAAAPAQAAVVDRGEGLTHAQVAPDFVNAGRQHGRDFVVGLMKDHYGAAMYDKVPKEKLAEFRALLLAGPQAAQDPNSVADLMK